MLFGVIVFLCSFCFLFGDSDDALIIAPEKNITLSENISGARDVVKQKKGTLLLVGKNTYTGRTVLQEGTLGVFSDHNLGIGGPIVFEGGALEILSSFSTQRDLYFSHGAPLEINGRETLVLQGGISGEGSLVKKGAGTLVLSGQNRFSGGTLLKAGILSVEQEENLGANAPLLFLGGALKTTATFALERDSVLQAHAIFLPARRTTLTAKGSFSGPSMLILADDGTLALLGNNSYSGGTLISLGTLALASDESLGEGNLIFSRGALQIQESFSMKRAIDIRAKALIKPDEGVRFTVEGPVSGKGLLVKAGKGALVLQGKNSFSGGLCLLSGELVALDESALGQGPFILSGGVFRAPESLSVFKPITIQKKGTFSPDVKAALHLGGALSGRGDLWKEGQGTLILTGENSYKGKSFLEQGILEIHGPLSLSDAHCPLILREGVLKVAKSFTSSRDFVFDGEGKFSIDPGVCFTAGGLFSGKGTLVKEGEGTLALEGVNRYSGSTQIVEGTLSLASQESLGAENQPLVFQGGSLLARDSFSMSKPLIFAKRGEIAASSGVTLTLEGLLTGEGGFPKQGTGTVVLQRENPFLGDVFLRDGILSIAGDRSLGDRANKIVFLGGVLETSENLSILRDIEVSRPGIFQPAAQTTLTIRGVISGRGGVMHFGRGELVLENANSYQGCTVVGKGTLKIASDSSLGISENFSFLGGTLETTENILLSKSRVRLCHQATFSPKIGTTLEVPGQIVGRGTLIKSGEGTLILKGENLYTGNTKVCSGKLELTSSALPTNVETDASLVFDQAVDGIYGGAISGKGSVTKKNTGSLTLSGNSSYRGGTFLLEGALFAGSDSAIGAKESALTIVGGSFHVTSSFSSERDLIFRNRAEIVIPEEGIVFTAGGNISGQGGLLKKGKGTLVLKGDNSCRGQSEIFDGILEVEREESLGTQVILQGGALKTARSFSLEKEIVLEKDGIISPDAFTSLTLGGKVSGKGTLTKMGSGKLVLTAANTFLGGVDLFQGTLCVERDTNLGQKGVPLIFRGGALQTATSFTCPRAMEFQATAIFSPDASTTLTLTGALEGEGALLKEGKGTLTLKGPSRYLGETIIFEGSLEANHTNLTKKVKNDAYLVLREQEDGVYSGNISGKGVLEKKGQGTLSLQGSYTYTGGVVISEGALRVLDESNLGDLQGPLVFQGGGLEVISDLSLRRALSLPSKGVLEIAEGTSLVLGGEISGASSLVKKGKGTLTLTGNNSYSGGVDLVEGALLIGKDSALGNGGAIVFRGGSFHATSSFSSHRDLCLKSSGAFVVCRGDDTVALHGTILGKESFVKKGRGSLILGGTNCFSHLEIQEGILQVEKEESLGENILLSGGVLQTSNSFGSKKEICFSKDSVISPDPSTVLTLSGPVVGAGNFLKSGEGVVVLQGDNHYSGTTHLFAGVLSIEEDSSLGHGPLLFRGGALQTSKSFSSSREMIFKKDAVFSTDASTTLTLTGALAGEGSLLKQGQGTLALKGPSRYLGETIIFEGSLEANHTNLTKKVKNDAYLVLREQEDGVYSGNISGKGDIVKMGRGTLALRGVNTYKGDTQLLEGKIAIFQEENLGDPSSSCIFRGGALQTFRDVTLSRSFVLDSEGIFAINPHTTAKVEGLIEGNARLVKKGEGALFLQRANHYQGGTLLVEGALQIKDAAALGRNCACVSFDGGTLQALESLSLINPLEFLGQGTVLVDPSVVLTVQSPISGSGDLRKYGAGTLALQGPDTSTGKIVLVEGALRIAQEDLFSKREAICFAGGTLEAVESLSFTKQAHLQKLGSIEVIEGKNLLFTGKIQGEGDLYKRGEGALILEGENSYKGHTFVEGGTLSIREDCSLGDSSNLLTLDRGTLQTTGNLVSSRRMVLNREIVFDVGQDTTLHLQGIIEGDGGIYKAGEGILKLSGNNSYLGSVVLAQGEVLGSAADPFGYSEAPLIFRGGSFHTDRPFTVMRPLVLEQEGKIVVDNVTMTVVGAISGAGALHKQGQGELFLSGENTFSGGVILKQGTLKLRDDYNLGAPKTSVTFSGGNLHALGSLATDRNFVLEGPANIRIAPHVVCTVTGAVFGQGDLVKTGEGTLALRGKLPYQGGIFLKEGFLEVEPSYFQKDVVNEGTLIFDATGSEIYGGVISGKGAVHKKNGGHLTFAAENSYLGDTTLYGGVLSISSDAKLGGIEGKVYFIGGSLEVTKSFSTSRNFELEDTGVIDIAKDEVLQLDGVISGRKGLSKKGEGDLILLGVNRYQQGTEISQGTLTVDKDESLGRKNSSLIFSQSTFKTTATFSMDRDISLAQSVTIAPLQSTTLSSQGSIRGEGSLWKMGDGRLHLTGHSFYTGGTTLKEGTLRIGREDHLGHVESPLIFAGGVLEIEGSFTTRRKWTLEKEVLIDIDAPWTLTMAGDIEGSCGITKRGAGELFLTGRNLYGGELTVLEGSLRINPASCSADICNRGTLIFAHDESVTWSKDIQSTGAIVKMGKGALIFEEGLQQRGTTTICEGSCEGSADSLQGDIENEGELAFHQNCSTTYKGVISGSGSFTKKGPGKIAFLQAQLFSGGAHLEEGTLVARADCQLGAAHCPLTFRGGALEIEETFATDRQTTLLGKGTFVLPAYKDLTLDGPISGPGTLSKEGEGTLFLRSINHYSGGTEIHSGRVVVFQEENLGHPQAPLLFCGGDLWVKKTFSSSRNVVLHAPGEIAVEKEATLTLAGQIYGEGGFVKRGEGKLILLGQNSYRGAAVVLEGMLEGNSGSFAGDIINETAVLFDQKFSGEYGGNISGKGTLVKMGALPLFLQGNNSYSGGTVISEGELIVSPSALSGNVSNYDTLSFYAEEEEEGFYAGVISGKGAVKKLGKGSFHLRGQNSFSGPTIFSNGTLVISEEATLGKEGAWIFDNGTLGILDSFSTNRSIKLLSRGSFSPSKGTTLTLAGKISGPGNLVLSGEGTLVLQAEVNYQGQTVVDKGTLYVPHRNIPGDLHIDGEAVFDQRGARIFKGALSGSGILRKISTNTLTLVGENRFEGLICLEKGTLQGDSRAFSSDILNESALIFRERERGIFAKTISGSGTVTKTGKGHLIFKGHNCYTGLTTVSQGVLQTRASSLKGDVINDAVLILEEEGATIYPFTLSGTGEMRKIGAGTLVLASEGAQSLISLEEGTLVVQKDFASDVAVCEGARLKGRAHILGDVLNRGVVRPGTSIGTQKVLGGYRQATGSTLEIELSPDTTSLLHVGGAVHIEPGAVLSIVPQVGHYKTGTTLTFLTAEQGIEGAFSEEIQPFPGLSFTLLYDLNSISFILGTSPLGALFTQDLNPNAYSVAENLDTLNAENALTGDLSNIFGILLTLPNGVLLSDALNTLHPAHLYGFTVAQERLGISVEEKVMQRLHELSRGLCSEKCEGKKAAWIEGIYSFFDQNTQGLALGYSGNAAGMLLGVDTYAREDVLLGAHLGFTHLNGKLDSGFGESESYSGYLGTYGAALIKQVLVQLEVMGSANHFSHERNIQFSTINRKAKGDFWTGIFYGTLDLGPVIDLAPVLLTPFAKGSIACGFEEGFKEHGAGALSLTVEGRTSLYLRAESGLRLMSGCSVDGMKKWWGDLHMSWVGEYFPRKNHYICHFASYQPKFSVNGLQQSQNLFSFALHSHHLLSSDQGTLSYGYEGEFGSKYQNNSFYLRLDFNY